MARYVKTKDGEWFDVDNSKVTDEGDHLSIRHEGNKYRVYKTNISKDVQYTSGCFVATVVYGCPNSPEVKILREFRDKVLKENCLGRVLVDLYYSGFGESISNILKEDLPSTIPFIKKGLDFIVRKYHPIN